MQEQSDCDLVRAIQKGDILAYEVLVRRYERGLFSFVFRIVRDDGEAQEIVQDTLFAVYKTIDRINPEKKFSTYLFEIAKNRAISCLRSRKSNISLDTVQEAAVDADFFERVVQMDEAKRIKKALADLPKAYAEAIRLYYFHDLSYVEVGKTMHIPLNTVRTRLRRGRQMLKKALDYEKKYDIRRAVMEKVVDFEERRTRRWFIKFFLILVGMLTILAGGTYGIINEMIDRHTVDLLSLFREDWEIITEYWQDTLMVAWEESPQELIVLGFSISITIGAYLYLTAKKRQIQRKKLHQVAKYKKNLSKSQKGGSV